MNDHNIPFLSKKEKICYSDNPCLIWEKTSGMLLKNYFERTMDHHQLHEKDIDLSAFPVRTAIFYSADGLLVFVEVSQADFVDNDRAYQHGDGFHFVLATPKADNNDADEFYVIAISPFHEGNDPNSQFFKKFIWYRNINDIFISLPETDVTHRTSKGKTTFLVTLPFNDIPQIYPLLLKSLGFNFCYSRALPDNYIGYYMLLKDESIGEEECLRKYKELPFVDLPAIQKKEDIEWIAYLNRAHATRTDHLRLSLIINGVEANGIMMLKENDCILLKKAFSISSGINRVQFDFNPEKIPFKNNKLTVEMNFDDLHVEKELPLYIFDEDIFAELASKINMFKERTIDKDFKNESVQSFLWNLNNLKKKYRDLHHYSRFLYMEYFLRIFSEQLEEASKSKHGAYIPGKKIRLAFKVSHDNTVQPYTMYIPENFSSSDTKKLIVMLHGSAMTDESGFGLPEQIRFAEKTNSIILLPNARGPASNFYDPEVEREEVIEITEKIARLFSIPREKIILSGFSMGGYGVLRIYHHKKELFKGLIVMSGYYKSMFSTVEDITDYNNEKLIKELFSTIPMIFFHGDNDLNCSFPHLKAFVDKIKEHNPDVKLSVIAGKGHDILEEDYINASKWINERFND